MKSNKKKKIYLRYIRYIFTHVSQNFLLKCTLQCQIMMILIIKIQSFIRVKKLWQGYQLLFL